MNVQSIGIDAYPVCMIRKEVFIDYSLIVMGVVQFLIDKMSLLACL